MGLVIEVDPERRAGRPMRRFRAVADSFVVPGGAVDPERLLGRVLDVLPTEFSPAVRSQSLRRPPAALLISLGADDRIEVAQRAADVGGGSRPALGMRGLRLEIPFGEEASFERDLTAVLERYATTPGRVTHTVVAAWWPSPDASPELPPRTGHRAGQKR